MKNWKNTGKRSLSAFLALVMCLGMVCTTAFAEGEEGAETGPAVCTKADDCAAETHEADCPKYVAPEEPKVCETCGKLLTECEGHEEQPEDEPSEDGEGEQGSAQNTPATTEETITATPATLTETAPVTSVTPATSTPSADSGISLAAEGNEEQTEDGGNREVTSLSGEGTEENPFLINNLDDLIWFQKKVDEQAQDGSSQFTGKYVKLTSNIDLAGIAWEPIGSYSGDHGSFKGVFDGDNHTISNLNVSKAEKGLGFFAYIGGNAETKNPPEIKNVTFHNVSVKSTNPTGHETGSWVGGVVGNAFVAKITNVHVTGTVDIEGYGYVGGIVGHGYVKVDNCSVEASGTIKSNFWCVGGIVGYGGEGYTAVTDAVVNGGTSGLTITSAAGAVAGIIGRAEDNEGKQPCSGSGLSVRNVNISTFTGAFGDNYADNGVAYFFGGGGSTEKLTNAEAENVTAMTSTGAEPTISDVVASVGGKQYSTLQAAVDAANAKGDTVTLLADYDIPDNGNGWRAVSINKSNLVLNLNSKTLKGIIWNYGGLTITGDGTISSETCAIENWHSHANLTIESGTFSSTRDNTLLNSDGATATINGGTYSGGFGSVLNNNGGVMTINNGTFQSCVGNGLSDDPQSSTMTVNNGTFTAETANALGNAKGTVTINGGSFTGGTGYASVENQAEMVIKAGTFDQNQKDGPAITNVQNTFGSKADLTIKGGTFTGWCPDNVLNKETCAAIQILSNAKTNVQGGTFTGMDGAIYCSPALAEGTKFISGGTFSSNVTQYCAPGLVATKGEGEDKYTVGLDTTKTFVAQVVGGGAYEKLADAIKDCPAGGTVKVLADVSLTGAVAPGKAITIEGVTKEGGSKPVISGDKGLFSVTKDSATLKNLGLQATGNTWYIYHSAGEQTGEVKLTVNGCDFTMAEGVTNVGNLIMTEGTKTKTPVVFTNNKVVAHSRVALSGPGDNTVITGNEINLVNERYDTSRTSVIGLTATANTSNIIISGNTFKNANRVLAVDNSPNMPADKLTFNQNKIIDCRYALEVSPEKNASQKFNIDYNYYKFNDEAPRAPRVENADASGSHTDGFATELTELGTLVTNNVHYTTEALSKSLSVANASVQVGNTVQLTATSSTLSGPVTWSSGDTGVATVSETGVVTGVTAGTVTITAWMGDTSATCTVTVSQRSTTPTNPGNTGTSGGGSSSSGGGGYRPSGGGSSSGGGTVNIQDPDVPLADLPLVFTDVEPDAYYVNAVKWAVQEKITSGTSSTTFSPNATCTRAQMVTFLWRAAGSPAPKSGTNPFTDVVSGAYYYDAVLWAVEQGITSGTSKTMFSPDAKVTRGQSVTFLYRAAGSPAVNDGKSFDDVDSSAFYAKAVQWAAEKGVTSGTTKSLFKIF